jgi:hypothetical protein
MRATRHMKAILTSLAALALGFTASLHAVPVTNVTVANVTPSSFSVVWSMEGTPAFEVFANSNATSNLAGIIGIEFDPVHTGNSGLTDEGERRVHRAALRNRARTLGLGHVRVSRLQPDTTYYFRITQRAGNSTNVFPVAGLASVKTAVATTFVPEAQQLIIEVPGLDNDGRLMTLSHTNAAFALAAVVGDGAGTNQVIFNTADLIALGGQTNFNPNGSLTFTADLRGPNDSHNYQQFNLVFDGAFGIAESTYTSLGLEFAALSVGSTIMRAGNTGAVTLTFNASVPVRQLTAQLQLPTDRLASLALSNFPAAIANATITSNSPTTATLQVNLQAGQTLQGALSLGQLWFRAVSNQTSAFLPVRIANPVLTKLDNSSVSNVLSQAGRIVMIGEQPLMESIAEAGGSRRLTIYGKPWSGYALEYNSDLRNTNGWRVHSRHPFTNMFVTVSGVGTSSGNVFYRAAELRNDPPALEAFAGANGSRRFVVYGQAGGAYTLQTASNLSGVVTWTPVLNYTLTNGFAYLNNVGTNTAASFFRLRRN